jgi:hypothetical protein
MIEHGAVAVIFANVFETQHFGAIFLRGYSCPVAEAWGLVLARKVTRSTIPPYPIRCGATQAGY